MAAILKGKGSWQRSKTHCPRGHPYDEENTRFYTNASGGPARACIECARLAGMASYEERKRLGICVDCQVPAVPGKIRCAVHGEKERLKAAAKRLRNPGMAKRLGDALRRRRIAAGLCMNCKNPALPGKRLCTKHRQLAKDRAMRSAYQLTQEELLSIRAATHCALCGGKFRGSGQQPHAPAIDHDHKTGKIRAVIHQKCNVALGMFEENISLLRAAISYLERFSYGDRS